MIRISQESIEQAVLDLFRTCGVSRCGGRLLQAELEHRWRLTRFRRGDFASALRRLEQKRCLRVHRDVVLGPDVELTVYGFRQSTHPVTSARAWVLAVRCRIELALVRRRPIGRRDDSRPSRRIDDGMHARLDRSAGGRC